MIKKLLGSVLFLFFILQISAATFTVTNTHDSGSGSLRDAIDQANATVGSSHLINFNIPLTDAGYNAVSGVWVIAPLSPLPYITRSGLTLDATTQTVLQGNTNVHGPEIMLTGNDNTIDHGFFIFASGVTVRGFIISDFTYGIQIYGAASQNNLIAGNYVGTNAAGTDSLGNDIGIELFSNTHNNVIGGSTPANRNVVSGNRHIGIRAVNSSYNSITGNFVGTDRTGSAAIGNYDGVSIEGISKFNMIGGSAPGARNIVSGNIAYGIPLFGAGTDSNIVVGNYIGTDTTGLHAVPNTYGVLFDDGAKGNIVGLDNPLERNVISGNSGYGVFIYNMGTTNNFVTGNYIGTDPSGSIAVPNGNGIVIDGAATAHTITYNVISGNLQQGIAIHITQSDHHIIKNNKIGTAANGTSALGNGEDGIRIGEGPRYNVIGDTAGGANIIAFNGMNGVNILEVTDDNNRISGNSIFRNGKLGIDLFPPGVTLNDASDADDGPNNNMNFPEIDTVIFHPGTGETTISGRLDTPLPQYCAVEIFKAAVNLSGYGEGKTWIRTVYPDISGNWSATIAGLGAADFLTATATDSTGNTSEFSVSRNSYGLAGVPEISHSDDHFAVFPNPCNDHFEIKTDPNANFPYQLRLYGMDGRQAAAYTFDNAKQRFDVSPLRSGNYTLVVLKNDQVVAAVICSKGRH